MHSATYSPEDNKLRLYPESRLSPEDYAAVKAAGFRWAPKQELFVAPSWTPNREDFLIDLCGEIGDEDTSLVDRAEAKAERLEDLSARRAGQAESASAAVSRITDAIPFGQPILVGHHSERRARKDAEKIENGMRRAVDCWQAAEYWKQRAAGAVRLAKYKERPDVRARRIKGLEAEKRKCERNQADANKTIKLWENMHLDGAIPSKKKDGTPTTFQERARFVSGNTNTVSMNVYQGLAKGTMTPEEAQRQTLENAHAVLAVNLRWIEHLENRLAYERAMLGESGGLVADRHEIEPGGKVLICGEWTTVKRVNRKGGQIVSVTTSCRYVPVRGVEQIQGYQPPTAEQAAAAIAAAKLAPLCNYPGERFATCTDAEWKAIPGDYKTSVTIAATATAAAHRVKTAIGYRLHLPAPVPGDSGNVCEANRTHTYWPVYVTDAKRKDAPPPAAATAEALTAPAAEISAPPAATPAPPGPSSADAPSSSDDPSNADFPCSADLPVGCSAGVPARAPQPDQPEPPAPPVKLPFNQNVQFTRATDAEVAAALKPQLTAEKIHAMRETLRAGFHIVTVPQLFPTPPALAARMVTEANIQTGDSVLEPSAGTGALLDAMPGADAASDLDTSRGKVVAVEINADLCQRLTCKAGWVINADFLAKQTETLGTFDRVLMNPPFANGADIQHIRHALKFLRPGGRLVAICANGPRQRAILKPLAEDSGGWWEDLPPGTFAEQGTNVNAALLLIEAAA